MRKGKVSLITNILGLIILLGVIVFLIISNLKLTPNKIFKNNLDTIVEIKASTESVGESHGSAIIYDESGLLITNAHVIAYKRLGQFDCKTMDGNNIKFERSKAKELLAYLIYRQGASSTAKEIAASIFEDSIWSEKEQSYFRQIVLALTKALNENGISDILVKDYNSFSIRRELIDCDYYDVVFKGKKPLSYQGEFMVQYEWAEDTNYYLESLINSDL